MAASRRPRWAGSECGLRPSSPRGIRAKVWLTVGMGSLVGGIGTGHEMIYRDRIPLISQEWLLVFLYVAENHRFTKSRY